MTLVWWASGVGIGADAGAGIRCVGLWVLVYTTTQEKHVHTEKHHDTRKKHYTTHQANEHPRTQTPTHRQLSTLST